MQTPSGHCRCKKTQTPSTHEPKTAQTASQKTVSRYLWNPHKTIFGATEHMPSLCKHHLDTADAKRPKHHLDTSRKPPKPQAKKLFHVTFGIHIKQSLEPQSTCPAYANTIWNHIKQLWSHRAHAQPMQTPSGHCRCKKTQTPSKHEPKTAQTASQKTVSRYLWTPHKTIFGATEHMPSLCKHHLEPHKTTLEPQSTCPAYANTIWTLQMQKDPNTIQTASQNLWNPHKTIFGATEHMPSLCKYHLDTADAKRPKHHLDTSRKPPKPQAKKLFHVTFGLHIKQSLEPQSTCPAYANTIWNHIKQLWSHRAHAQPMQTPSGHCRCKKTQTPSRHEPKTAQTASQKTVSRYLWNPHKTIFGATEHMPSLCKHHLEPHKTTLEPQSTCPAYANTIWTLQMQKDPNTIQTASQKTVSRYLWNPHK